MKHYFLNRWALFFLLFFVQVACQNKSSTVEIEANIVSSTITVFDIDMETGMPVAKKGKVKFILDKGWLFKNCYNAEQINFFREKVAAGNGDAANILLASAWFILPGERAFEIVKFVENKVFKEKNIDNSFVYYYLGLFHKEGFCVMMNNKVALSLFQKAYQGGCLRAGIEYFDLLAHDSNAQLEIRNWIDVHKNTNNSEYQARIAWAQIKGIGLPKDEQAGWVGMLNAANNRSRFANRELGRKALNEKNLKMAVRYYRNSVCDILCGMNFLGLAQVLSEEGNLLEAEDLCYRDARRMGLGGLKNLAQFFESRGEYEESAKIAMLSWFYLLRLKENENVQNKTLEDAIAECEKYFEEVMNKQESNGRITRENFKDYFKKAIGSMIEKSYYFHPRLEERFVRIV